MNNVPATLRRPLMALCILIFFGNAMGQKQSRSKISSTKPEAQKKADAGPGLQETFDWLNANFWKLGQSRLTEYEDGQHFFYSYGSPVWTPFQTCKVILRMQESVVRNNPERATEVIDWTEFTVDLSTLDPNKVSIVDHKLYWAIELHTTNEGEKIAMTSRPPSEGRLSNAAFIVFGDRSANERQLAERVASALRNAIELCGGRRNRSSLEVNSRRCIHVMS